MYVVMLRMCGQVKFTMSITSANAADQHTEKILGYQYHSKKCKHVSKDLQLQSGHAGVLRVLKGFISD